MKLIKKMRGYIQLDKIFILNSNLLCSLVFVFCFTSQSFSQWNGRYDVINKISYTFPQTDIIETFDTASNTYLINSSLETEQITYQLMSIRDLPLTEANLTELEVLEHMSNEFQSDDVTVEGYQVLTNLNWSSSELVLSRQNEEFGELEFMFVRLHMQNGHIVIQIVNGPQSNLVQIMSDKSIFFSSFTYINN